MDATLNNPLLVCLSSCPLFENVQWRTLQLLAHEARLHRFERGRMILHAVQEHSGLFLVNSGQVKLSLLSPTGAERVIEVIGEGGTFGESILFARQKSRLNAQMLSAGEVVEIPQAALKQALQVCPSLATALTGYLSSKICRLLDELENCCLRSARQRVMDYLLMLQREQRAGGCPAERLALPASKGVTASLLDITPETFSRELTRLSGMGLIEVDRKWIRILDEQGLWQASQAPH